MAKVREIGGVRLKVKPFTFKRAAKINEWLEEATRDTENPDSEDWTFRFWLNLLPYFAEPAEGEDKTIDDIDPHDYCMRDVQEMYRQDFPAPSMKS